MANDSRRNTNNSQWFITLDRADELTGKHTLFGRIQGPTYYSACGGWRRRSAGVAAGVALPGRLAVWGRRPAVTYLWGGDRRSSTRRPTPPSWPVPPIPPPGARSRRSRALIPRRPGHQQPRSRRRGEAESVRAPDAPARSLTAARPRSAGSALSRTRSTTSCRASPWRRSARSWRRACRQKRTSSCARSARA